MIIGLVILLLRGWVVTLFSSLIIWVAIKTTSIFQMQSVIIDSSKTVIFTLQAISSIIAIFAGGIVGHSSKKLGWLYGVITGLLASAISLNLSPLLLIETFAGGWLGERMANSQKKLIERKRFEHFPSRAAK